MSAVSEVGSRLDDIQVGMVDGLTVLSSRRMRSNRRLLFVNCYGGAGAWQLITQGVYPTHHLWGCVELVRLGYEVGLAAPVGDFVRRRAVPHDLAVVRQARTWLRQTDLVYCGHNVLFWAPAAKRWGLGRGALVALLYAREPLAFAEAYEGVIGLTPAATDQARLIAPKSKADHLSWGADLDFFPEIPYEPGWFLSCGKTYRDFDTLVKAAALCGLPLRLVCPDLIPDASWPKNVTLVTDGRIGVRVPESELIRDYYPSCTAALIISKPDPNEEGAVGFTSLIEAMALARPVIVTKTGALAGELDVEKAGCGLHVPPDDPEALAEAMTFIEEHPEEAAAMGRAGRKLCEAKYNTIIYAAALHRFFEAI